MMYLGAICILIIIALVMEGIRAVVLDRVAQLTVITPRPRLEKQP